MSNIEKYNENIFESIKKIDEFGNEFWSARELQKVLDYKKWDKFIKVILNAQKACDNSKNDSIDHFLQVGKLIETAKGAKREIIDYKLSRYACYLIVQNANLGKEVVALGQTYFAIQTRKQEITMAEYESLSDDDKRLYQRNLIRQGNYTLQKVAANAGVKNMAEFHNAGYKGLYNEETADDIFKRNKLHYREDILDNMGEDEMIANLFRIKLSKNLFEII